MEKVLVLCLILVLSTVCLAQDSKPSQATEVVPQNENAATVATPTQSRPLPENLTDQSSTTSEARIAEKKGSTVSVVDNVKSSMICQTCSCATSSMSPLVIDCTRLDLQETFPASDWPNDVLISSIAVSFGGNQFTEVRQFPPLPILRLSLRDNSINPIEKAAFKYLYMLEYLDLSRNSLTHESLTSDTFEGKYVENEYEPVPIKVLKLGYNEFHSLGKDVFDHLSEHLETLELNNNPLNTIDQQTAIALTTLRKLRHLNLAETELSTLPEGLLHALPNLKVLILSGNQFSVVPAELQRAIVLEQLNINNNPITKLEADSFQGLSRLRQLNVSSMPTLRRIGHHAFTPLQSMTHLWCSYNPALKSISPNAFGNMGHSDNTLSLNEFHFKENRVGYLSRHLLPWNDTEVVDIAGNPFVCDCHVRWIAKSLVPLIMERTPELTEGLACAEPAEFKGLLLEQLPSISSCAEIPDNADDDTGHPLAPPVERSSHSGAIMLTILGIAAMIGGAASLFLFLTYKKTNLRRLYDTGSGQIVHYVRTAGGSGKIDDEQAIVEKEFTQFSPVP